MILINGIVIISLLTQLSLNGISRSYQWITSFLFSGLLEGFFYLYLNFNKTFYKQTVETLIDYEAVYGESAPYRGFL